MTSPVARGGMGLQQLIGPSLLIGGLGSLCLTGMASVPTTVVMTCFIYLSGIVPENEYFPKAWFKSNIFTWVYRVYCSDAVGYTYMRPMLHARRSLPHSDYRHGVRCLSGVHKASLLFPVESKTNSEFYERGGGLVDLKSLGDSYKEGYRGVAVVPVPLLTDNYAYLLLSFATKQCAVVDPADPKLVLYMLTVVRYLTKVNFVLTEILTTHKHWDHAGGNLELLQSAQNQNAAEHTELVDARLKIFGSMTDKPHACTDFVEGGEVLTVAGGGVTAAVFSSPGHTAGSLMFLVGDAHMEPSAPQRLALFTGDCIFCGGCGAMFEVTAVDEVAQTRDLFFSERLRTHPATKKVFSAEDVLVYVGHEYTERLIGELLKLHAKDPNKAEVNPEMRKYRNALRAAERTTRLLRSTCVPDDIGKYVPLREVSDTPWRLPGCTVPSTLAVEQRSNPLLTVKRSLLESLQGGGSSVLNELQKNIYASSERQVFD
ncbi:hydroxyacylglutathione hydrolase [Trypanosoma conorhini]|uniref:hydroxyacylglutathione hydrolase n=1 Tax=Trypanosoma conorhini TaxID=83891 RepID=A0A422PSR2_9TRYP|nr:hydroxyacylglutathione hydrolase [Trypanosoma conorhini]RNF20760.1 hydroxyacylglutathione hydrolase [Trypanosoma conorhini]